MEIERPDAELIKAFKEGDAGALGVLIERYQGRLCAYLAGLSGDRAAADDLAQEVFVKVLKRLDAYGERERFSAWLFTVAHHAAMDRFRACAGRRESSLDAAGGDGATLAETLVSAEPGPEKAMETAELAGAIRVAFGRLSLEQREVFLMRHYSGLSFKEIAGIQRVPIGTVLARMSRAVAKMRAELELADAIKAGPGAFL